MPEFTLHHGNCLDILKTLPPDSIDSIVTDPPYGLKFMGKRWDYDVPSVEIWAECLRVLKPGGHLLAFAGTRTQHRMAVRIEDAGFEIRDMIAWVYGSGFPKSHNLEGYWQGWGTALKPAMEPITVARKPLIGTVAENALQYETGALNIDACRVPVDPVADATQLRTMNRSKRESDQNEQSWGMSTVSGDTPQVIRPEGRWPANLIHDGSEEVLGCFPNSKGEIGHLGGPSRFFKCINVGGTCPLCCLPYAEASNTLESWKITFASSAERRGWTSSQTGGFFVRFNAIAKASERIVRNVKSAGNLCDSCAISIAAALVAIKTSVFSSEELQAILVSTGSFSACILTQNLASFAELWESIDTTPTTRSLSILFGSVFHAIENSTRRVNPEREESGLELSRFAYVPKASKADRDHGLDAFEKRQNENWPQSMDGGDARGAKPRANNHPTVKPTNLMRYLCRLVTPVGGVVLDPFMGSGSTGKAAMMEGFRFVGIELDQAFIEVAKGRISSATSETP